MTLAPLCSDSSTFEGLGAQVAATLGPKLYQKGVRVPKSGLGQGRLSGQDRKSGPGQGQLSVSVRERLQVGRNSSHPEGKVYLSGQSYD